MSSLLDAGKAWVVGSLLALGITLVIAFVAFIISSTNNATWIQAMILIFNIWYIVFMSIVFFPLALVVLVTSICYNVLVLSGIGDLFLPVINFFFGVLSNLFGVSYTQIGTLGSQTIDLSQIGTLTIGLLDQFKSWLITGEFYQQLIGG